MPNSKGVDDERIAVVAAAITFAVAVAKVGMAIFKAQQTKK